MKGTKIQHKYLAIPAADEWALWAFEEPGKASQQASAATCSGLNSPPECWVALPSVRTFAIPMILAATKPEELRDMIVLQLESRGIAAFECMDYSILRSDDRESVVVAWVLPALPSELADLGMIERCVPSAFARPVVDNACTIWREAGHWSCAVKIDGKIVAVQTLGASQVGDDMKTEVLCLVAQLLREKILPHDIKEIVIRGEVGALPSNWPYLCRHEMVPDPIWPDGPGFFPGIFAERKSSLARQSVIRRSLAVAGLVLVLVTVGFVGHTAWLWMTYQQTTSRLTAMEPQVSHIKRSANTWNAVAPAVDPEQSGVEILYRCARHIPSKGVRFTLFQIKDGTVLLVGEGDNVSGVVELQNKLANDKELAEYRWKMPPPRILPNNVARFEISGDRLGYVTVQK